MLRRLSQHRPSMVNNSLSGAGSLRSFDVTARFANITAKVLYVLSRTDRLFPPEIAAGVMQGFKAAAVDADYFLLDSAYSHSASGRDADSWSPRLRKFIARLEGSA